MERPLPERRRSRIWLLATLVLVALVMRVWGMYLPWDGRDFHSAFVADGSGPLARGFYLHGFQESGFMPFRYQVELADGTVERSWYSHHPALYSILSGMALRLFGTEPWVLHLPALIFSLLSILACHRLARDLWGEPTASLSAAFFAFLPMSAFYGILPWTEIPCVWVHLLLLRQYVLWLRTSAASHFRWVLFYVVFGALFDWQGHLILPWLLVHFLVFVTCTRRWRLARSLPWLFIAAALPIGLHWLHMKMVLPPGEASADTKRTLEFVTDFGMPLGEFVSGQVHFIVTWFTWPGALILAGGFVGQWVLVVLRRLDLERGIILTLPWTAIIYVALVPSRSVNHDFFLYMLMPWAALTLGTVSAGFLAVGRRLKGWFAPVSLIAVVLLFAWCGIRDWEVWERHSSPRIENLVASSWVQDLNGDEDTVIVTTRGHWEMMKYFSSGTVIGDINSTARLEGLRSELLSRLARRRRVKFIFDWYRLLADQANGPTLYQFLKRTAPSVLHTEQQQEDIVLEVFDITEWVHK